MVSRLVAPVRRVHVWPLVVALVAALALRLALWGELPRTGLISDEGEYLSAGTWLAQGRGFAWYQHYLWTRAPLYPLFVAVHRGLFGESLAPIFLSQTVLSLFNVALVYVLAWRAVPPGAHARAVAFIAALLMALAFPFAVYTQVLLSETLYVTLLLASFLVLVAAGERREASPRPFILVLTGFAGGLLGLATLTRSLTLLFVPLAAGWLVLEHQRVTSHEDPSCEQVVAGRLGIAGGAATGLRARLRGRISSRGISSALALVIGAAAVVAPWTIYNSNLYGGLVLVDTSGAFNLLLGARTAYDGGRSDAPTRNYVLGLFDHQAPAQPVESCAPYPGALPSQAARQHAMIREGACLIAAAPGAFVTKTATELIDLFQINYTGAERFTDGFTTGRLPVWYTLGLFVLDDTLYVLVLPLVVIGWALAPRSALRSLAGWWWLYNIAVAPLLFAINRFRLPLLPLAFIFAAYALVVWWRSVPARRVHPLYWALALVLLLIATTPYAYLAPHNEALPSYLGRHPASLASTVRALERRPAYLRAEAFRQALVAGDTAAARATLAQGPLALPRAGRSEASTEALALALLAAREGRPEQGLGELPPFEPGDRQQGDVEAAVVRGDLLRSLGELELARQAFSPTFVDNANPVEWAWNWLQPGPTTRIDLAGDLDLGYVWGCYLGEGDPVVQGTFRWCSDGARLRFPAAGSGRPQALVVRVDGRGWRGYAEEMPPVRVLIGGVEAGSFTPSMDAVSELRVPLPPAAPGADIMIELRTSTFIPDATDFLGQQGAQAGQVRRLGVRLDWAELRPSE